jgi:hypothetical protein
MLQKHLKTKLSKLLIVIGVCLILLSLLKLFRLNYIEHNHLQLPIFNNEKTLKHSMWLTYLEKTYHSKPHPYNLPIDLNSFDVFYQNKSFLTEPYLRFHTLPLPLCPTQENQSFQNMSLTWDPPNTVWLAKKAPFKAASKNTWVEVTHSGNGTNKDYLNQGSWMYLSKGSGIFFYTGQTIVFKDHPQAVRYFLHRHCTWPDHTTPSDECINQFPALFRKARQQGYDSIQFTEHGDQRCGLSAAEIVDLQGNSSFNCGDKNPNNHSYFKRYRTGFNHQLNCICQFNKKDPYKGSLNCDGTVASL